MANIYTDIAAGILPSLPYFTVDGDTEWTVRRTTKTPFGAATVSSPGKITLYIVRNDIDKAKASADGNELWSAQWLAFGELGQSVTPKVDDILEGSKRQFKIIGQPQDDFAMWFIPLADYNPL